MAEVTFQAGDLTRQLVVKVKLKGFWIWTIRRRIGIGLFKLGARFIGCQIEVESEIAGGYPPMPRGSYTAECRHPMTDAPCKLTEEPPSPKK